MSAGWIEMRVQIQNPDNGDRRMCYKTVQISDRVQFKTGEWDVLLNEAIDLLGEQVLSEFAKK